MSVEFSYLPILNVRYKDIIISTYVEFYNDDRYVKMVAMNIVAKLGYEYFHTKIDRKDEV